MPVNESPSYSVRVAPGKHGAIVSGVFSAFQAASSGASMVNLFSNCIDVVLLEKAGRLPRDGRRPGTNVSRLRPAPHGR